MTNPETGSGFTDQPTEASDAVDETTSGEDPANRAERGDVGLGGGQASGGGNTQVRTIEFAKDKQQEWERKLKTQLGT